MAAYGIPVVEARPAATAAQIRAVGRLSRPPGADVAQFSLLVADPHQRSGLGTALLKHLVDVARREGLSEIWADVRMENAEILKVAERLGFSLAAHSSGTVRARLAL